MLIELSLNRGNQNFAIDPNPVTINLKGVNYTERTFHQAFKQLTGSKDKNLLRFEDPNGAVDKAIRNHLKNANYALSVSK